MTIQEWDKSPELRAALKKAPVLVVMLSVLESERPVKQLNPTSEFAFAYGQEVGYQRAMAVIERLMSGPPANLEQIEATFQPDQPDKQHGNTQSGL